MSQFWDETKLKGKRKFGKMIERNFDPCAIERK